MKQFDKKFDEFWKPLLQTNGEWDEKKIKNELHDLDFVAEQVGYIYSYLTGGLLSKPMHHAGTILAEFEDKFILREDAGADVKDMIEGNQSREYLVEALKEYFEIVD